MLSHKRNCSSLRSIKHNTFQSLQNCPYVNNGSQTVAGNVLHMDDPSTAKARGPNIVVLVR